MRPAVEKPPAEIEEALKSEGDPEFQGPGGQQRFLEYMAAWEQRNAPAILAPDFGPSTYEREMYRLAMKIKRYAHQIRLSEFRLWPGDDSRSPAGTPWSQPAWRARLLDAFWEGYTETSKDGG